MTDAQIDELEQLAKNSGWFNIKCVRDVIAFARETLADNERLRALNATLLAQQTRTITEDIPALQARAERAEAAVRAVEALCDDKRRKTSAIHIPELRVALAAAKESSNG